MPINILSFNSMIIKIHQYLPINVIEPTFIKRLQDVDRHDKGKQMKIINAYFYDKSNATGTKGKYDSARADINDPFLVIPLINQEGMALMIRFLRVDDDGSHYHSTVKNQDEFKRYASGDYKDLLYAKQLTCPMKLSKPIKQLIKNCYSEIRKVLGYSLTFAPMGWNW